MAFGSTQLLANTHTDTLLIGKQKTGKKKQLIFLAPFMCRGKQFSHYAYARWYRINVIKTYLLFGAQNLFAASWLAATYVNLFFIIFLWQLPFCQDGMNAATCCSFRFIGIFNASLTLTLIAKAAGEISIGIPKSQP